jgi:hypothetical protein
VLVLVSWLLDPWVLDTWLLGSWLLGLWLLDPWLPDPWLPDPRPLPFPRQNRSKRPPVPLLVCCIINSIVSTNPREIKESLTRGTVSSVSDVPVAAEDLNAMSRLTPLSEIEMTPIDGFLLEAGFRQLRFESIALKPTGGASSDVSGLGFSA